MSNYIQLFYVDVITYPCHKLDAGLTLRLLVKEAHGAVLVNPKKFLDRPKHVILAQI